MRFAPNLYYRRKDDVEAGAKAALGGSAAARPDAEQEKRIMIFRRASLRLVNQFAFKHSSRRRPLKLST
jgi:hypothetical protein